MTLSRIEAFWRDLDRLEGWEITNHMKFYKSKHWILHLGQGNLGYMYRGDKRLKSSATERHVGVLVDSKLSMS